jgi:lipid-binding SYLF domain-containing protein
MNTLPRWPGLAIILVLVTTNTPSWGQSRESVVVDAATAVLDQIMSVPARRIPESLLMDARGIAIIPDVLKGGFVVGVRHGRGVFLVRDQAGVWQPPTFVTLTGGSIGWQAGVQATDVILVFKSQAGVQGLMQGKFTIGADVAAAAGPVGRQASAGTDSQLQAEVYSYSRSRGLFAGVALDGSALQIDPFANAAYYQASHLTPQGTAAGDSLTLPPSAVRLLERVSMYTGTGAPAGLAGPAEGPLSAPVPLSEAELARRQLLQAIEQLYRVVDEPWKKYLALPAEVYAGNDDVTPQAIRVSLARFDTVAQNPKYQALANRPEFQTAHQLLRQYAAIISARPSATLTLPPPPTSHDPQR